MSDAASLWGPLANRLLSARQKAEVAVVRGRVLREVASGKSFCTTCGVECPNDEELGAHKAAHKQASAEFGCAICGVRFDTAKTRNIHEHTLHKFQRYPADDQMNGAVSVSNGQLQLLENVGFLFGALQSTAQPSSHAATKDAFTPPSAAQILQKMEQSTGHKSARLSLTAEDRNEHEQGSHDLERSLETRYRKEAVKIPKDLHPKLRYIGMNFELIQQRAIEPPPNSSANIVFVKYCTATPAPYTTESPLKMRDAGEGLMIKHLSKEELADIERVRRNSMMSVAGAVM
ncbi:hypothetical protein M3Y99_00535300 [Aphelenchoides fujianensis]|nr:hypothetical protein M3Y99_00535300 [Aphelenchoides fujianensis]